MNAVIRHARLPLAFDPAPLRADLARVEAALWTAHFNTRTYVGDWSGVSLRAVGGRTGQLADDPGRGEAIADTPLLDACPGVRAVLDAFRCPLEAVRLLRLAPGARILEHRDFGLCVEDGVFRVHVPVLTNPDVAFMLAGERVVMEAGSAWYLNFNMPHAVANGGTEARVHLVVDGRVNGWVDDLLARSDVTRVPSS